MHTRTQRQPQEPMRLNLYRIGAVIAEGLSFATTYAFVDAALKGSTGLTVFLIAGATELVYRSPRPPGSSNMHATGRSAGAPWCLTRSRTRAACGPSPRTSAAPRPR